MFKNKKSNKTLIIVFLVGCIILVCVGYFGNKHLQDTRDFKAVEEKLWKQAQNGDSELSYSKYLLQYPDGEFSEKAKNRVEELKNKEDSVIRER